MEIFKREGQARAPQAGGKAGTWAEDRRVIRGSVDTVILAEG